MSESSLHISVASHHFKLTKWSPRARQLILGFREQFIEYTWEKVNGINRRVVGSKYYAYPADMSEIRFHINVFEEFQQHLRYGGIHPDDCTIEYRPYVTAATVDIEFDPQFKDRGQQIELVDTYLINPQPSKRKMLPLPPGSGKSYLAMRFIQLLRTRAVFIMKKGYCDKWLEDFPKKLVGYDPHDFMLVTGSVDLMALTQMARDGMVDAKMILIGNETYRGWLTLYEELGRTALLEQGYGCAPDELFQLMQVGARIIDETHQDFHFQTRLDLYTHVEWSLSMSGSYDDMDLFIKRMMEMVNPFLHRYNKWKLTRFVHSTAVMFRFNRPEKIRSTGFRGSYSHVIFEQSILKQPLVRKNYFEMICHYLDIRLKNPNFLDDDQVAFYCATVDMATFITEQLKRRYPERHTVRFCRTQKGDKLDDALGGHLVVSTLQSSGTNIDFPRLRLVFLLISIEALASNIQGFGRIRDNMREGVDAEFVYFTNVNNPKQMKYYRGKEELLRNRAKSVSTVHYQFSL